MKELNYIPKNSGLSSALERVAEIKNHVHSIENRIQSNNQRINFSSVLKDVSLKSTREQFGVVINQAAKDNNVNPKLIEAVIEQESGFNPGAVSKAGALGLMQLMPETALAMGVKNPLNPQENIRGGTKYLSSLLSRYQGNVTLALSAYNAGPGNIEKYNGVPPFEETKKYLKNVLGKFKDEMGQGGN